MKNQILIAVAVFASCLFTGCSSENQIIEKKPTFLNENIANTTPNSIDKVITRNHTLKYLALGDSYTIGQSVCETCKFPEQLQEALRNTNTENNFSLKVIARTGWTTNDLINAIDVQNPATNYDLVTLLIGVNNQFQNIDFAVYEKEFSYLIDRSIAYAKGNKANVIVISIPDYAYTPYGQLSGKFDTISAEISLYNAYAKKYCDENGIAFSNITTISQNGLTNPSLVAIDGLHPSETAYTLFTQSIAPKAAVILNQ